MRAYSVLHVHPTDTSVVCFVEAVEEPLKPTDPSKMLSMDRLSALVVHNTGEVHVLPRLLLHYPSKQFAPTDQHFRTDGVPQIDTFRISLKVPEQSPLRSHTTTPQ